MAQPKIYDAIVVGLGASGGWAIKELTAGGMNVLALDAGSRLFEKYLHLSKQLLWEVLRHGNLSSTVPQRKQLIERQPIQSQCYAWGSNPPFFVDDINNPYTTPNKKPFLWFRSRQIGGRLIVRGHGRQLYRLSNHNFKAASHDGYGEDWPIGHDDLEPYYTRVERWIGVNGSVENISNLPDSVYLNCPPMTTGEKLLQSALTFNPSCNYKVIRGRTAPPKLPHKTAKKTGKLTLKSQAVVSHILVDKETGKAAGVAFIDQKTKKTYEVYSNVVVLCASAIESTRILLNSKTDQHPAGLGNSSGMLGHYLMDHIKITLTGLIPNPERFFKGVTPKSDLSGNLFIPQFRNLSDQHPQFIRGYGVQAFTGWNAQKAVTFSMSAYGEMLPRYENCVTLNHQQQDAYGIPTAHIECQHSDNEQAMAKDMTNFLKDVARSADLDVIKVDSEPAPPGTANHEVGTARMGDQAKTSVLNKFNQSWDVSNLFVLDGACFTSQGYQNPTLTMMAIAARSCDFILHEYKRDQL